MLRPIICRSSFGVRDDGPLLDVQPFSYPQEEIRDTVFWFREHAGEYGIDSERFALMGYSAGDS